jgi:hypothetical protein
MKLNSEDELLKTISTFEQIADFPPPPQQVMFCYESLKKRGYPVEEIQKAGYKHFEKSRKFPMPSDLIPIIEGPNYWRERPLPPKVDFVPQIPPANNSTVEQLKHMLTEKMTSNKDPETFKRHIAKGAAQLSEKYTGTFPNNLRRAIVELVGEEFFKLCKEEMINQEKEAKKWGKKLYFTS